MFRTIALTALAAFAMLMAGCKTCGNHCGSSCDGGYHGDHGCATANGGAETLPAPDAAPPAETVPQPPPAESGGIY